MAVISDMGLDLSAQLEKAGADDEKKQDGQDKQNVHISISGKEQPHTKHREHDEVGHDTKTKR